MKKGVKKEENYMKKGGKGLKMHLFGLKTSTNFFASPHPMQTCSLGKKLISKEGEGEMIEMHNIYPCWYPDLGSEP